MNTNSKKQSANKHIDERTRQHLLRIKELYKELSEKMKDLRNHDHELIQELRKLIDEEKLEQIRRKLNQINDE